MGTGIYTTINTTSEKPTAEKIRYRCYKNYDVLEFNKDLKKSLEDEKLKQLMETENVNEATERWIDIFSSTANRHAPIKEGIKNIKRKYIPWFTSELKEMIEEKNRRLKL